MPPSTRTPACNCTTSNSQQALVGLNVRQAAAAGEADALAGKLHELRNRKEVTYTQQDAEDDH